jgi:hypothetical protein
MIPTIAAGKAQIIHLNEMPSTNAILTSGPTNIPAMKPMAAPMSDSRSIVFI